LTATKIVATIPHRLVLVKEQDEVHVPDAVARWFELDGIKHDVSHAAGARVGHARDR